MKKIIIFVITLLFAVAVPMASMAHEGPGDADHPGMSCGMRADAAGAWKA